MNINRFLFFSLFLLTFLSCKEKDFEFQVINETGYSIKKFALNWGTEEDKFIKVHSYVTTEVMVLPKKGKVFGSLCHGIYEYANNSVATEIHTINCGWARAVDFFSTEKVNKIFITLNPETPDTTCRNGLFILEYE